MARRSPAIALPAIPVESVKRPAPAKKPHAWVAKLRSLVDSTVAGASEFFRLFSYTRPYRGRLLLSWLATAGYAASGAILVSKIKPIFDEVLIQGINVGRMALVILGLYLVKGVCSYVSTTLVASVGQRAVTDLRNDLYQHILRQSFTFLGRNTTGSLMSHITTDVEKIQNAVSEMAGDLLKEGLTVLGLLIVLFYMDWRLAILSLVGMPLAVHSPRTAGPAPPGGQRNLPAALAGHLRDPAGDDLGLPRGEGVRHGELRDRPLPARRGPALPRQHADHADERHPPPAHGGGGRLRPRGRALLRQPLHPLRAPHHRAPSCRSWPRSSRCTRR